MKRILNSCLFILTILISGSICGQAQFSVVPQDQCYNTSGTYTADAGLFQSAPSATSYTWTILSPPNCQATFSLGQHGALNSTNTGSQIAITYPCCGVYTIIMQPMFNPTITAGPFSTSLATIYCPNGGSASVNSSVVCLGSPVTFSGTGGANAQSYTWTAGSSTFVGNPFTYTPTVNTCATFTATTAQGCTIAPAPVCASVQAVTGTVSPASQTICANVPICLTATGTAVNNSSSTLGTFTTGISFIDPFGAAVPGCTTAAVGGTYFALITHTGAAGSCTFAVPSVVVISTSINVTASASAPSVCPGATVQLLGASVQTAATSYTFYRSTTNSIVGNPVIFNPTIPTTYTVRVDYFGCPGSVTIPVGMLSITPTLTPSSFFSCPGQPITFTASGAQFYTFRYWNTTVFPNTNTVIGTANSATNVRIHTPTITPNFPAVYSVFGFSNGCQGSTTITVLTRTLFPTLVASSPSVCPNTEFTLTAGNVGNPSTYTFSAPYGPIATASPTVKTVPHTPPFGNPVPHSYTVTADSAGCRGTAVVIVGLKTQSPILTPSSLSICPGGSITLSSTGGAGTTYTFTGPIGPGPPVSIYTGPNSTVTNVAPLNPPLPHSYTVSVDSAGCVGSASITIGQKDLSPLINITPSSASICPNTAVTLTATVIGGGAGYNYTIVAPGNNVISTSSVGTHSPPSLAATYTVFADSTTCVGSNTITIFEKKINPSIIASPTLVCKGAAIGLTATGVGSGPNTTYQFGVLSPVAAPLPSGSPTFSFTTDNPTVQTVYTVLVDSAGCTGNPLSPPTVTVFMRPDLVLTPSSSASSVCPGTSATLSVTGALNNSPITYSWTQIAGSGSISPAPPSQTAVVHPITNSTYSVNGLDSLGCIGSTVFTMGIDPNIKFPLLIGSSGSTICAGQSSTLSATYTINTIGSLSFSWSPVSGPPVNNSTIVVSPSVTTTYSLVVANQYGCAANQTFVVPVGQYPPLITTKSAAAVCAGFTSTITAFGANSYSWTGSTFTTTIPQQSISVGPGTYTVLGSNGGGCTATAAAIIGSLSPLQITVAQSSGTTCITSNTPKFSKPVNLTASGAATYVWFPYNPNNMTYSLGPSTDVRPPASTCYTVIGSTAICAGQTVVCVTVIPQFSMTVLPPLPAMCLGDSLKLSVVNISSLAVGPPSAFTYSWTEAANAPPISISNNLTPTVMVFPQNTTTYSVEVMDSRQCISLPKLVTVTVLPQPLTSIAIPTINSVATNSVCYVGLNPGALDITINLIGVNINSGLQFGVVPTYTWIAPYKDKYNSILTPPNNAGITVNAPVKLPSVVVYTLISGYNGIPGCKRMDTVSVRVVDCRPIRDVKFTTTELNDTICARECITFQNLTDTMAGGPQKVLWKFPGGSPATSTLNIPTVCYNLPNSYNVILTVENPYPVSTGGSSRTIGQLNFIRVVDYPNVTIVPPGQSRSDTTVRFGQSVNLNGTGALTYEWSPSYNITSLTNPKVKVSPFKTTQYILTGYNSKRCWSSDTINVIVIDDCGEMYVPNAFTPNNDGVNDVLYVRGICLQSLTFMIFNRWGEKVFETSDQKIGWDGTFKSELLNTGVFVYRLEGKTYDGKGFSSKGNITLIR